MLNDFIISHDFVQLVMKTIAIIQETWDPYFLPTYNCEWELSHKVKWQWIILEWFCRTTWVYLGGAIESAEWVFFFLLEMRRRSSWESWMLITSVTLVWHHHMSTLECAVRVYRHGSWHPFFFPLINFATSWQYSFVFSWFVVLDNSFFLSFFQGPAGMPEFNALLNTTYWWDDRVTSWIMYVRICGLKISLSTYYVLGWCFSPQPKP